MTKPDISVVVPLYNEEDSVLPLVDAIDRALTPVCSWELILVDDGSSDHTAGAARQAGEQDGRVRLLRLARNYGQTAAMQAGFDHATADVVVSMDGDLQNDPADIPLLLDMLGTGYDLVAGYRVRRQDRLFTRKVPSWVANRLIQWVTGVPIRDNGCSLKAYRRSLLQRITLYSDMHRFIPAVAAAAGARIAEVPVRHHARQFGHSKYGLSRVAKVLADLLTITMIRSFRERPLVMFGVGASLAFLCSLLFVLADLTGKLAGGMTSVVFSGATLLFLGLVCYLLMLGLVAEALLQTQFDTDRAVMPAVAPWERGS
jgi:glycosyltransferase involved in cell wall biosynthesis